jgi:hypothetical protein
MLTSYKTIYEALAAIDASADLAFALPSTRVTAHHRLLLLTATKLCLWLHLREPLHLETTGTYNGRCGSHLYGIGDLIAFHAVDGTYAQSPSLRAGDSYCYCCDYLEYKLVHYLVQLFYTRQSDPWLPRASLLA